MAGDLFQSNLEVVDESRSGFKRRQNTMVMAALYYIIALLVIGVCVGVSLWTGEYVNMWRVAIAPFCFWAGLCFHYCQVEDLGDKLKVTFGPLAMPCNGTSVEIPYRQMAAYRSPDGCCEGCCGYGFCQVNKVQGGIRQHSLWSCGCHQKQIVIELKQNMTFCVPYSKIVIAVAGADYEAFVQMMN